MNTTGIVVFGHRRPHLLRQVLENLLSNAWKFTKNKDVARIEFGMYQNAFFVKDNGAGFEMAGRGCMRVPTRLKRA